MLGPRDQIGVVAFDIETYWVSRLHSAADKDYLIQRISTLATGGGTNMYPAMGEALRALQTAVAKLKHVIILTDGMSSPGDFTGVTADMVPETDGGIDVTLIQRSGIPIVVTGVLPRVSFCLGTAA